MNANLSYGPSRKKSFQQSPSLMNLSIWIPTNLHPVELVALDKESLQIHRISLTVNSMCSSICSNKYQNYEEHDIPPKTHVILSKSKKDFSYENSMNMQNCNSNFQTYQVLRPVDTNNHFSSSTVDQDNSLKKSLDPFEKKQKNVVVNKKLGLSCYGEKLTNSFTINQHNLMTEIDLTSTEEKKMNVLNPKLDKKFNGTPRVVYKKDLSFSSVGRGRKLLKTIDLTRCSDNNGQLSSNTLLDSSLATNIPGVPQKKEVDVSDSNLSIRIEIFDGNQNSLANFSSSSSNTKLMDTVSDESEKVLNDRLKPFGKKAINSSEIQLLDDDHSPLCRCPFCEVVNPPKGMF